MNEPAHLRRRDFLRIAASAPLGLALATAAPRVARADASHPIVVSLFLRGGLDGLSVLVPFRDPGYASARPTIRIAAPSGATGSIEVADGLALHPALRPLEPMIRAGEFRIAPAVGLRTPQRSHFEAQHLLEVNEDPRSDVGFLSAALAAQSTAQSGIAALCLGPTVPTMLRGPAMAISLGDIAAFQSTGQRGERARTLGELYANAPGPVGQAARDALEAARVLTPGFRVPLNLETYPAGQPRGQLAQAARFIRADLGIRVFHCELGGWDTHANQGGAEGQLANRLGALASNLARFFDDLGDMRARVRLVCFTEFGRTVRENGSGGTDHGAASVVLTLGQGVGQGGVIDGAHPGLGADALLDGRDLRATRQLSAVDFGFG